MLHLVYSFVNYKTISRKKDAACSYLQVASFVLNYQSASLVKLRSCRDPVVYEQEVEHLVSVILVDRAEVALAERLEIYEFLKQRLYLDLAEIDRNCLIFSSSCALAFRFHGRDMSTHLESSFQ